jgi:hypothetical protein
VRSFLPVRRRWNLSDGRKRTATYLLAYSCIEHMMALALYVVIALIALALIIYMLTGREWKRVLFIMTIMPVIPP